MKPDKGLRENILRRLFKYLIIVVGTLLVIAVAGLIILRHQNDKVADDFHRTIRKADRVVVRIGGYNCCGSVDEQEVAIEISDSDEIKEFKDLFKFNGRGVKCMCCGYPGIDWYKGEEMIALTGMQHCFALRWKGFGGGDAHLTDESSVKLAKWMLEHGVPDERHEFAKRLGLPPENEGDGDGK